MKIKLTEKYKPFSHEAGVSLLIPRSSWKATIFPAKIQLESLLSIGGKQNLSVTPHLRGPLTRFTVMQDLERHWVRVFGEGPQGYFSYRLVASSHEIILFFERGPEEGISFTYLEKILSRLEKAKLIKSKKGVQGGYCLAKPAKKIKTGEIINVLEGKTPLVKCLPRRQAGLPKGYHCPQEKSCLTKSFWGKIQKTLDKSLNSITLADLIKR